MSLGGLRWPRHRRLVNTDIYFAINISFIHILMIIACIIYKSNFLFLSELVDIVGLPPKKTCPALLIV